jgi:hypothetical protein
MSPQVVEGQFHRNAGKYKEFYVGQDPDNKTFDTYRYIADVSMVQQRVLACLVVRLRDMQVCYILRSIFITHFRVCSPEEVEAALKQVKVEELKKLGRTPQKHLVI